MTPEVTAIRITTSRTTADGMTTRRRSLCANDSWTGQLIDDGSSIDAAVV